MNAREKHTRTAVMSAARAWGECALESRGTLREMGVHGTLRRLDDYASGARGRSASTTLAEFARVTLVNGMSKEAVTARLVTMIARTVDAVSFELTHGGAA